MTFHTRLEFVRLKRVASFAALLILLLLNTGDLHSRFCLDGQEPAVSFHLENLNGHPDHGDEERAHNDYEYELSLQTAFQAKVSNFNHFALIDSFQDIFLPLSTRQDFAAVMVEVFTVNDSAVLLPPLRAPPASV